MPTPLDHATTRQIFATTQMTKNRHEMTVIRQRMGIGKPIAA